MCVHVCAWVHVCAHIGVCVFVCILHSRSVHVMLYPLGGAASSAVHYGNVFIQSYFSYPVLSGSMKSAQGLQNQ